MSRGFREGCGVGRVLWVEMDVGGDSGEVVYLYRHTAWTGVRGMEVGA